MTDIRLALFTDTYAPQMNGVARTLALLADAVRERGGAVRVYTCTDPAITKVEPGVYRAPSIALPFYKELRCGLPSLDRIERDLREFQPTMVHAASPFAMGLAGRRLAQRLSVPFVTSYHTSLSAYAGYYKLGWLAKPGWRFLKWFHNSGLRTYCPTIAVQRELTKRGFDRLAVWSRGVDGARFTPRKRSRSMRMRMGGSDETMIVAYVGRIAKEKGIDLMLGASRMLEGDAHFRFAFAGDGPVLDECRARAPYTARFVGRLDGEELAAFYASADMFVFPSTTDTFGNVLVEAMASGLPIVAADTAQAREVAGAAAYYYNDVVNSSLAEAIVAIASHRDVSRQLASNALARARIFRWDAVFDALIGDYQYLLATPPTPDAPLPVGTPHFGQPAPGTKLGVDSLRT